MNRKGYLNNETEFFTISNIVTCIVAFIIVCFLYRISARLSTIEGDLKDLYELSDIEFRAAYNLLHGISTGLKNITKGNYTTAAEIKIEMILNSISAVESYIGNIKRTPYEKQEKLEHMIGNVLDAVKNVTKGIHNTTAEIGSLTHYIKYRVYNKDVN